MAASTRTRSRARSEDPSRTKTVRREYARRLRGAYGRINAVIRDAVGSRDIFGLREGNGELLADVSEPEGFQFVRDDQKIEGFTEWLDDAQEREVLTVIDRDGNQYVERAYERGIKNAHADLRAQGVDISRDDVREMFNQPVHRDKLQALYTRNFQELSGITKAVDQQVSRELTEALIEGVNPTEAARRITDRVDSIGKTRAEVLARTEILNAHNEAALTRFEQTLGADAEVRINAEILSAQDARVCEECEPRHGDILTIDQARQDGPPWHPRCRCVVAPVVEE